MKRGTLFLAAAPLALAMPAYAGTTANNSAMPKVEAETKAAEPTQDSAAEPKKSNEEVFSTGVAKGRDRLDSATSTSALRASEIDKQIPGADIHNSPKAADEVRALGRELGLAPGVAPRPGCDRAAFALPRRTPRSFSLLPIDFSLIIISSRCSSQSASCAIIVVCSSDHQLRYI